MTVHSLQEVLAAARTVLHTIKHAVRWRTAAAANRVMAAKLVLDDGEDWACDIRVEHMSGRQEDRTSCFHSVGRVVPLLRFLRVVAQEVHSLTPVQISDA